MSQKKSRLITAPPESSESQAFYAANNFMGTDYKYIARTVAEGAHAVLLLDCTGLHATPALQVPKNMNLLFLP